MPVEKFFDVTEIEFDVSVKNKETKKIEWFKAKRQLVYCTDPNGFVDYVKKERDIGEDRDVEAQLGIDAGGGFLKLCLTLVETKKKDGQFNTWNSTSYCNLSKHAHTHLNLLKLVQAFLKLV